MRQFLMSTTYILTLTLILCQRSDALANCDGINFGLTTACPYICRCSGVTACDNDGGCSGPCASGWFGPACQYADLSTSGTTVMGTGTTAKILSNGWSCLSDSTIDVVTFIWNQTFPFTWLRVIVNSTNSNSNFTVTFRESDSTNSTFISCSNQKVTTTEYDKYRYKKDVHCVVDVPVQQVILTGPDVRHLCSLHISGGRNVALRQYSEISTQHSFYGAAITSPDKAVDGSLATYTSTQVTYYNVDDSPNCVVVFTDARLVNRYVIYNYASHKELRGFILESFNSSGRRVFYYQDKQTEVQDVYYVNSLSVQTPIKIVRITATEPTEIGYAVRLLMIRELEAYGDSVCSPGYFGRDCEYTCNCAVTGEPCLVSTGNCPSGCAAGYYEDGCRSGCPPSRYGVDCLKACSVNCLDNLCHPVTGVCYRCNPRLTGDYCDKKNACDKGWFGPSCQYKCHCTNSSCDEMYGNCTDGSKCEHGWFGTACQYEDTVANGSVVYSSGESPDPITDSMIETCVNISNPVTLTVTFFIPYPFTWIRFVLQNTSKVETFSISFTDSNKAVIPCLKRSYVDIDDQTRDIHCDVDVLVNSVSVSGDGVGSLCSLYVSGGRNVALRQPTSIYSKNTINSTSFYDFSSLKAVDGFLNVTPNSYDCARTYPTTSLWFINFTSPQVVNRIIVYTTNYQVYEPFVSQYFDELLGKFTVEGYAADYSVVFRNMVDTDNPQRIYTLYVHSKLPVVSMRIKGGTSYWRVLTLCEVEIFGDTVCPPGTYGRDCEEQCTCNGPCTTATQMSGFYLQYCNTGLPTAAIAEDCPAGQGVVDGYIMAGTTATCACVLTEPGYPAGHAQWLTADGKLVGSTGNNVSILSLTNNNLRFRDGLQPYLCKAVSPVVQISNGSIFSPTWAFGPDVVQFTVNLQRSAVVDTGSSLTLFCEVEADPPAYAVIQGNGYGQIKEVKSDKQTLTVTLINVTCDDSGFYICEGQNGLSKLASGTYDSVDIRVKCPPRLKTASTENKTLSFRVATDQNTVITLEVTGYPEPTEFRMKTETGLLDPAQYRVTYIKQTPPFGLVKVEVKDADKKGTTSYILNAQNTQGGLDVSFDVIKGDPVNDPGTTTKDGNSVFLIIIGVLAAVVTLLLIVLVISLPVCRRNQHLLRKSAQSSNSALNRSGSYLDVNTAGLISPTYLDTSNSNAYRDPSKTTSNIDSSSSSTYNYPYIATSYIDPSSSSIYEYPSTETSYIDSSVTTSYKDQKASPVKFHPQQRYAVQY